MRVVHVDIKQDESGAWIAQVRELPACHTYGRSIRQATERIHEAMQLFDELKDVDVEVEVRLPPSARRALRLAKSARQKVEKITEQAQNATALAIRELANAGVSVRDAAAMLGVSSAQVHQIMQGR